ncbi:MAG: hypothetical protein JNL58_03845 [Planctomyces sp.]|nr:hypothetical protein [Planctomyces sp.]
MKSIVVAVGLIWMVLVLEISWPEHLPGGCLLLPVVCGTFFWFRSATGILIAGAGLLIDAILRPTTVPLSAVLLPILSVLLCSPRPVISSYAQLLRRWKLIPMALELPLFVAIAVCVDNLLRVSFHDFSFTYEWYSNRFGASFWSSLSPVLIIAVPVSGLTTLLFRTADELGLRRLNSRPSYF